MALPSSVKIKKDGIVYLNNVDACKYTINELIRMALRDSGKLVTSRTKKTVPVKTGRIKENIAYWVRTKKERPDLQVGVYTWGTSLKKNKRTARHAHLVELGTQKMKARPFLKPTTEALIEDIERIQAQYLTALNEEKPEIDSEEDYEGSGE